MKPDQIEVGAVYAIGAGCGVPHTFRPIEFKVKAVLQPKESHHYEGMAWLDGEEINRVVGGAARFRHRQIYVVVAGMRLLFSPTSAVAGRARVLRAARNTGPVRRVPRPRTPAEPTTRRTR